MSSATIGQEIESILAKIFVAGHGIMGHNLILKITLFGPSRLISVSVRVETSAKDTTGEAIFYTTSS